MKSKFPTAIVAALQAVQPNDWRAFLRQRLDTHEVRAPLGVDAMKSHKPIDLLVNDTSTFSTLSVAHYSGQQYPHLLRADAEPDRMADIVKAKN
jgi:hypothetical protein